MRGVLVAPSQDPKQESNDHVKFFTLQRCPKTMVPTNVDYKKYYRNCSTGRKQNQKRTKGRGKEQQKG